MQSTPMLGMMLFIQPGIRVAGGGSALTPRYKIEVTFLEAATAAPPCSAAPNIHGHLSAPDYSPIVLFYKLLLSPATV